MTTQTGGRPLARAVVTYSRPSTSSIPERVRRLVIAMEVVARVAAGSAMWRRPSQCQNGPPRPETGSQPSCRLKSQIATMASQNTGMDRLDSEVVIAR